VPRVKKTPKTRRGVASASKPPTPSKPGAAEALSIKSLEKARQKSTKLWRNIVEKEAVALWKVRQAFAKDDNGFSWWLSEHDVRLAPHDRAALIAIGRTLESEPKIVKEVLGNTDRLSLQLIWREEIKPRLLETAKELKNKRAPSNRERVVIEKVLPARVKSMVKTLTRDQFLERLEAQIGKLAQQTQDMQVKWLGALAAAQEELGAAYAQLNDILRIALENARSLPSPQDSEVKRLQ
jgi:hypothetical protein